MGFGQNLGWEMAFVNRSPSTIFCYVLEKKNKNETKPIEIILMETFSLNFLADRRIIAWFNSVQRMSRTTDRAFADEREIERKRNLVT